MVRIALRPPSAAIAPKGSDGGNSKGSKAGKADRRKAVLIFHF